MLLCGLILHVNYWIPKYGEVNQYAHVAGSQERLHVGHTCKVFMPYRMPKRILKISYQLEITGLMS